MNTYLDINGILLVDKPQGFTSFDVIAKLRGILKIKRLGHSGTLDPMATGVLPVLVGKSTKASDILPVDEKSYAAGFKLGISTDTQDITGETLSQSDLPISLEQLERAAESFVGDILQVPPMYSAVSVGGKRLYELAREGKTIEREARQRKVNYIKINSYDPLTREGVMSVSVSKGTYVRTLIHDIGEKLECGGVMTSLRRMTSSGYDIGQCYTLEQIQQYADEDNLGQIILPVETAFNSTYDKVRLNAHCTQLYKNGVKLRLEQVGIQDKSNDKIVCIYDCDNVFLGLAQTNIDKNELKIYKNFF
ncbi:MAG: tRNA pseudouridine(55) synthase TruB [Ruminococcus sp.]|nr:tRNA pseudouridine(55) synthase TruB [Ruminococcus sp.]